MGRVVDASGNKVDEVLAEKAWRIYQQVWIARKIFMTSGDPSLDCRRGWRTVQHKKGGGWHHYHTFSILWSEGYRPCRQSWYLQLLRKKRELWTNDKHRGWPWQAGTHCGLFADSDGRVCLWRPVQGDLKPSLAVATMIDFFQRVECRCLQSYTAAAENWRGEMLRLDSYIHFGFFANCCRYKLTENDVYILRDNKWARKRIKLAPEAICWPSRCQVDLAIS